MSSAEPPATASVAGAAPSGSPRRPATVASDVGDVARGAGGQERAQRRAAQRRGDRGAVDDDLARAEPAQRHLGRAAAPAAGAEPALRDALGRGDQPGAVGDAQAEQGEGGDAQHRGIIRAIRAVADH